MGLLRINRTYRNIQRMQSILNILLKHGFGQLIRQLGLHRLLPLGKQASTLRDDDDPQVPLTLPGRMRLALEELGPTFVKFGQVLSSRPDLLPENFINELKKLREDVYPVPFPAIRHKVMEELGMDLSEVFEHFEEKPIAAASIAQVHSAILKTGEKVVVKVMRPGIEKTIRNDLDILYAMAQLFDKHVQELEQFDPKGLVHEFEKSILKELNFTFEGNNTERFRINFLNDEAVRIPKVYWDHTTKSTLVLERIEGFPIDDIEKIHSSGLDPKTIASEGMRIFLRSILEFGFFHADPHPGNVLVLKNGQIGLVDFGMVGRLDRSSEENLSFLIIGLFERNYDKMLRALADLGFDVEEEHERQLRLELRDLVETYYGLSLQNLGFSDIFSHLMKLVQQFGIRVPPDFLMLSRALVMSEGVGRQLDPSVDIVAIGRPMLETIVKRKADIREIFKESTGTLLELKRTIYSMPRLINTLGKRLLNGKIRIEFAHVNLNPFYKEIERLGNRIALGLIVSSLILGSSLMMIWEKGPQIFGYPILGVTGYVMAGVLGFGMLIAIWRSGKF